MARLRKSRFLQGEIFKKKLHIILTGKNYCLILLKIN